jgi:hypothetical protein
MVVASGIALGDAAVGLVFIEELFRNVSAAST